MPCDTDRSRNDAVRPSARTRFFFGSGVTGIAAATVLIALAIVSVLRPESVSVEYDVTDIREKPVTTWEIDTSGEGSVLAGISGVIAR